MQGAYKAVFYPWTKFKCRLFAPQIWRIAKTLKHNIVETYKTWPLSVAAVDRGINSRKYKEGRKIFTNNKKEIEKGAIKEGGIALFLPTIIGANKDIFSPKLAVKGHIKRGLHADFEFSKHLACLQCYQFESERNSIRLRPHGLLQQGVW